MSTIAAVARAVVWNAAIGVGARSVGFAGTLVLARFISPDEYGQVSTAVICVFAASPLSDLEFGQYLIANDYRERRIAFHATCHHVALGLAALIVVFPLAFGLTSVAGGALGAEGVARVQTHGGVRARGPGNRAAYGARAGGVGLVPGDSRWRRRRGRAGGTMMRREWT